jgi:hypothetical protein
MRLPPFWRQGEETAKEHDLRSARERLVKLIAAHASVAALWGKFSRRLRRCDYGNSHAVSIPRGDIRHVHVFALFRFPPL